MYHEAGKGSKIRPGEGYKDNWETIFGKGKRMETEIYRGFDITLKDDWIHVTAPEGLGCISFVYAKPVKNIFDNAKATIDRFVDQGTLEAIQFDIIQREQLDKDRLNENQGGLGLQESAPCPAESTAQPVPNEL